MILNHQPTALHGAKAVTYAMGQRLLRCDGGTLYEDERTDAELVLRGVPLSFTDLYNSSSVLSTG